MWFRPRFQPPWGSSTPVLSVVSRTRTRSASAPGFPQSFGCKKNKAEEVYTKSHGGLASAGAHQLISTPTVVAAFRIVGEMATLHGDWVVPSSRTPLERAERKGMAGFPDAADHTRRARRKRQKGKGVQPEHTGGAEPEETWYVKEEQAAFDAAQQELFG